MAIVKSQKFLPASSSSSLTVRSKTISSSTFTDAAPGTGSKKLFTLKRKIIEVDKILKGTLASEKKSIDQKKKEEEKDKRKSSERSLEAKPKRKESGGNKLKIPTPSFFDRIKDFFKNIIAGYILTRLVDFANVIEPFLPAIGKAFDWTVDFVVGFVDGLGTFLAWGQDAADSTREYLKNTSGQDAVDRFNQLGDKLFDLFNAIVIVGSLSASLKDPKKPGAKPFGKPGLGGGISKPSTAAEKAKNARIRNVQKNFGPGARKIYENALNNGKTPSQAMAAVKRGIARGVAVRPGADSLAARTAPKGNILKGGLAKTPGRLGLKLFGKAGIKAVKGVFGKIPIMGPIIVTVASLLGGEPIGQALFKGVGAALGGLLGTFIPIPVIGTLLGETLGVFVGDLLYELILGKGISGAGAKLKTAVKDAMLIGGAVLEFFKQGFQRYINTMFEKDPINIESGFGRRAAATKVSEILNLKDFLKDRGYLDGKGQVVKFPNLLNFFNPLVTVPNMAASFLPAIFGAGGTAFGSSKPEDRGGAGEQGSGGTRTGGGGFTGTTSIGSGESGEVVKASHPEAGSGWTVKGQMDAQGRPIVLSKPGAEAFAKMMKDSGGKVKGSDVASSGRSTAKNESIGGHPNSSHMYGEGLDIHGTSSAWMKQNSMKYGWKWASGYTGHSGHFNFKIQSDTFNPKVMDNGGKIGKGLFMNKGRPEFVIDADSTAALEGAFPGFLNALNKADGREALEVLRSYAEYESNSPQVVVVEKVKEVVRNNNYAQKSSMIPIFSSSMSEDPFEFLAYQG